MALMTIFLSKSETRKKPDIVNIDMSGFFMSAAKAKLALIKPEAIEYKMALS
jgi:hypothetical protein